MHMAFSCLFFSRINIQFRESKEDYHKFLKFTDASDGRDHQQFMFLHDWKCKTLPAHFSNNMMVYSLFKSKMNGGCAFRRA